MHLYAGNAAPSRGMLTARCSASRRGGQYRLLGAAALPVPQQQAAAGLGRQGRGGSVYRHRSGRPGGRGGTVNGRHRGRPGSGRRRGRLQCGKQRRRRWRRSCALLQGRAKLHMFYCGRVWRRRAWRRRAWRRRVWRGRAQWWSARRRRAVGWGRRRRTVGWGRRRRTVPRRRRRRWAGRRRVWWRRARRRRAWRRRAWRWRRQTGRRQRWVAEGLAAEVWDWAAAGCSGPVSTGAGAAATAGAARGAASIGASAGAAGRQRGGGLPHSGLQPADAAACKGPDVACRAASRDGSTARPPHAYSAGPAPTAHAGAGACGRQQLRQRLRYDHGATRAAVRRHRAAGRALRQTRQRRRRGRGHRAQRGA